MPTGNITSEDFSSGKAKGQKECPLPEDWIQVFEVPGGATVERAAQAALFGVGGSLYVKTEQGVSMLGSASPEAAWWLSIDLPDTIDPDEHYTCMPLGNYVYLFLKSRLYFIESGSLPFGTWNEVVRSIILPSNENVTPTPLGIFKGQVYGWYWADDLIEQSSGFQICRSGDVGKTEMQWELVAGLFSFGQPIKYSRPAFLLGGTINWHPGLYDDRIWISTNTLTGTFGNLASYGSSGVEIWESSTGDPGSWSLINEPGFGTQTTVSGQTIRTNQTIQSAIVGFDGIRQFLLVGTATQFSPEGQIWRYDGTGVNGWQPMTPWWTHLFGKDMTRRFTGLVSWDRLYAAEGYPSGNLGAYDYSTNTWTCIVSGPNTFGPENQGLLSLAIGPGDNLYAITRPNPSLALEQKKIRAWAARVVCSL